MKTDKSPKHEFKPLCTKCGEVASTIQLFNEFGNWRLVYDGPGGGSGPSGDETTHEEVRAIITGFTEPYLDQDIRAADFFDDAGYCLQCCKFYCSTHAANICDSSEICGLWIGTNKTPPKRGFCVSL